MRNDRLARQASAQVRWPSSHAYIGNIYGQIAHVAASTATVSNPAFTVEPEGPVELPDTDGDPDPLFADLNDDGNVAMDDMDVLLDYLAYTGTYRANYDMNSDKELDAADYALLYQHILGNIYYLPISACRIRTSCSRSATGTMG